MGNVRVARQLPSQMVLPRPCSTQHVRGPTGGVAGRGRVPTRHTRLDLSYCRRTSLSLLPSPGICLECPIPPITNFRVPRPRGQPHLLLGVDNSQLEEFHPLSFAASLGSSSLGQSEERVCRCPKLLRNLVDAGSPRTGSGLSPARQEGGEGLSACCRRWEGARERGRPLHWNARHLLWSVEASLLASAPSSRNVRATTSYNLGRACSEEKAETLPSWGQLGHRRLHQRLMGAKITCLLHGTLRPEPGLESGSAETCVRVDGKPCDQTPKMSVLSYDNLIIKMRDDRGAGGGESGYLYYKRLTCKIYQQFLQTEKGRQRIQTNHSQRKKHVKLGFTHE